MIHQTSLPPVTQPAATPHLHRHSQSPSAFFTPAYWKAIAPKLHVDDEQFQRHYTEHRRKEGFYDGRLTEAWKGRMWRDGYFHVHRRELGFWASHFGDLAEAVVLLMQHGWPPTFINVFDEAWVIMDQVSEILYNVTSNPVNFDMLTWYIDPNNNQMGFSPHRDRQPDDSPSSFHKDGSPKYATCWIPLTDACPDNSCLYVIPRGDDPGYFLGDDPDSDPMKVALPSKESYQNIKCIPAEIGSAVIFSHRIIHWGSKGRVGYHTPRISFSFATSSDDFEPAYFSRDTLPFPELALRVSLSGGQMIVYWDRFQLSNEDLQQYHALFENQQSRFHVTYREKIAKELLSSIQEEQKQSNNSNNAVSLLNKEDDIFDKALDALLDAKLQGGDFNDDDFYMFDDLDSGDFGDINLSDLEKLRNGKPKRCEVLWHWKIKNKILW